MHLIKKAKTKKKYLLPAYVCLLITGYILSYTSFDEIIAYSPYIPQAYADEPVQAFNLTPTDLQSFDVDYTDINKRIDSAIDYTHRNSPEVKKVRNYLKSRSSPMAAEAENLVLIANKYGLPYNIMPAIAVIESGAGRYMYRPYNYAGLGGQSNAMTFSSYEEAIEKHAQVLKKGYFDKGATTPERIEKYYCYQCSTWGEKVSHVMSQIDKTSY